MVQVHDEERIREQEFGNLQQKKVVKVTDCASPSGDGEEDEPFLDEAQEMGRWGTLPPPPARGVESPADVYDRVSDIWMPVLSRRRRAAHVTATRRGRRSRAGRTRRSWW